MSKTIMIMAGGTGGHVYPAMAVADYLKGQGWKIVWLCTEGGMENRLIEGKGFDKAMITMQGVRGKGLLGWLLLPVKLLKASRQSHAAIKQFQPNVVLGMGGFAAFPGGLKAWIMAKPLVIHEQNSIAGLTNKVLAIFATRVLAAFPTAFGNKAQIVGNPVRQEITELPEPQQRYSERTGKLNLLIVGGSLGAGALNEIMPKALENFPKDTFAVVHQSGEKHVAALQANYDEASRAADTRAFISNMAEMYAWADVVICRAGALTIAELASVGVASVLVPFPHAVDDHQTYNAKYLSDAGAAQLIQQSEFSVTKATEILRGLTRENCLEMALKAQQLAKPQATKTVADICAEVAI